MLHLNKANFETNKLDIFRIVFRSLNLDSCLRLLPIAYLWFSNVIN